MDEILKTVFEGGVASGVYRIELVEDGLAMEITPEEGETVSTVIPSYLVQMAMQMIPGE